MKKLIAFTVFALLAAAGSSHAFDKEKFKTNFRKAFNVDSKMVIEVGDPTPSQFGTLLSFPVTIGGRTQPVYLSPDEHYYFWGTTLDLTVDPDVERANKLKLENVHLKGPKNAPVTIVEFSDIQCPNCQGAHAMIDEQLFKDFPDGKVRVIFKHFPLGMHDWAERGAVAAECAAGDGNEAFWKMTDVLFKNATEINTGNLKEKALKFAGDLKLNKKKYTACLDNPAILEKIHKDKEEGNLAGVDATPTFFVNGRMIRGNRYEEVKSVVEEKLKEAGK